MFTKKFALVLLLSLITFPCYSQGETVVIYTTDRNKVPGELIFVRGNGILLSKRALWQNADVKKAKEEIIYIAGEKIDSMQINGRSKLLSGLLLGASVGALLAALVVSGDDKSDNYGPGVEIHYLFDPLLGALVGGIVGILKSTKDRTIPVNINMISELRTFARFKTKEPDYLHDIK